MLIALTVKTASALPELPALLMPLPAIAFVCALDWLTVRYAEPWLRDSIRALVAVLRQHRAKRTRPV